MILSVVLLHVFRKNRHRNTKFEKLSYDAQCIEVTSMCCALICDKDDSNSNIISDCYLTHNYIKK